MRYAPDHKAQTRDKLLSVAAEQMRLHGPDGLSVAAIMKGAGLTHGGFYAHFDSKDALIAAAIATMFEHADSTSAGAWQREDSLAAFIDAYVSTAHRDQPRRGCPVPALMSEPGRWPRSARKAFDQGVARMAERLAQHLSPQFEKATIAAMSLIADMAGAVALSRAISDRKLSDELLAASRSALKLRFTADKPATRAHA
jgi:TetR/AcrR family transcriptional repressor of nem operon